MKYSLMLSLILIMFNSFGQKKQKESKELKKANMLFQKKEYVKASEEYFKMYQKDGENATLNYHIGICLYHQKDKQLQALPYFEKSNVRQFPEALFYKGNLYHLLLRFNEAINSFTAYNEIPVKANDSRFVSMLITKSQIAQQLMKSPLNVAINNMGPIINSPYPDYVPLLSADGSTLIFTSRRDNSTGMQKDLNGEYMEDIYISYKNGKEWTPPVSISKNLNTELHDACVALSPDGHQLIVYQTSDDLRSGDLYISNFTGTDWTKPERMGSDINVDDAIEASATFSQDNNMLIFSSDRPGGFGGRDLYKVVKLPNGEWSKAKNLGNTINTLYDEDAPFLHVDGKTLFFSSKAHKNMGGYDIFKSTLNEDDTWSEPENLGYPINTVNDDIYFILSVNGNQGYFSSRGGVTYGETDIFSIDIPEQNFGLAVVSCNVFGTDNSPLKANITLTENGSDALPEKYKSNKDTGKFIMILSPIKKYTMNVQAEGYLPLSKELLFNAGDFGDHVMKMEIALKKINNQ
jgi:Tol biopolymer transport system component